MCHMIACVAFICVTKIIALTIIPGEIWVEDEEIKQLTVNYLTPSTKNCGTRQVKYHMFKPL